ncbi:MULTISPECIES: glycoside hydrolase family 88 protein [unclassified Parabacteroides]|uniref:glycoside hydrolase family 88 protein n=1 Tax=unclassified Parabacteroides TaxID=2649774 RepID=UPI002473EDFB|nr:MULTISPECIES: glycoside hydrolase family 88 protein [unclassified Parabacteroides]
MCLFSCSSKGLDTTQEFKEGATQYHVLKTELAERNVFPKSYDKQKKELTISGSEWWCSGFYPGALLYLYEETKDQTLYNEAKRMLQLLKKEQFNTTTHDLGFMMFCSFGNAYRLDPKPEYKEILINSAKSLASRFDPTVGCIRSWDSQDPNEFIVIIDNMMNLELLFWASEVSGDKSLYDIAITHANTTIRHHFRPDYSSYHLVVYDQKSGRVSAQKTFQGYADSSAWARGQAWGLYGYTVMYRITKDKKYLDQAVHIAEFILNHPNLPEDMIPYWDFHAPDIPKALRDASAGAINASALLELQYYVDKEKSIRYATAAKSMLQSLANPPYKAKPGTNGGFILQHSVGHLPGNSEVDVPLTYADYYYLEALRRSQGNLY